MMANILILHGPNLNRLGEREQAWYGSTTLSELNDHLSLLGEDLGQSLTFLQSNSESTLIERIHHCQTDGTQFIIFNPAAFTHTSIALRDALLSVHLPFVEVHLSNLQRREPFRHFSYFSDIAIGTITGLGTEGYLLALRYAHHHLTNALQKQLEH